MPRERLQKILAQAGVASRRAAEELVVAGRVRVNGRVVTELGSRADPRRDKVEVDRRRIVLEKPVYLLLNKPRRVVTTLRDPEGRDSVAGLLRRVPERVFPVGRLDYHTSGALLLTNDGDFSEGLLRPRTKVPKDYAVRFQGHLEDEALAALRRGVTLDDGTKTRPAEVFVLREDERTSWVQLTLHEGKNRQIRRMGEAIGHRVLRLVRTSFAEITTEGLRPGEYRPLKARELERLKRKFLGNKGGGASRPRGPVDESSDLEMSGTPAERSPTGGRRSKARPTTKKGESRKSKPSSSKTQRTSKTTRAKSAKATGKPSGRAGKPSSRAGKPSSRADKPSSRAGKPSSRAGKPSSRVGKRSAPRRKARR